MAEAVKIFLDLGSIFTSPDLATSLKSIRQCKSDHDISLLMSSHNAHIITESD